MLKKLFVHNTGAVPVIGLALLLILVAVTGWPALASKRGRVLPRDQVATTWIGISLDQQYVVRLVLEEEGTGFGGYSFIDEQPRHFVISSWSYDAGEVKVEPEPPEGLPSWVSNMSGSVQGVTMHLSASGDDWEVHLRLRREAEVNRLWQQLKDTMAENTLRLEKTQSH